MRGKPKRDGSGKGRRANRGRGGCSKTKSQGQGRKYKTLPLKRKEDGSIDFTPPEGYTLMLREEVEYMEKQEDE